MSRWCGRCTKEGDGKEVDYCPIATWTMAVEIDDPNYPSEWVEIDGWPHCTAFDPIDEGNQPLDPRSVVRPLL
jgi:hypothetical protein